MEENTKSNNSSVKNYNITKFDSKIIQVIVNTDDRWVDYTAALFDNSSVYNSKTKDIITNFTGLCVTIFDLEEVNVSGQITAVVIIDLKDVLTDSTRYVKLELQEKDQISIYLIPMQLLTNNEKWKERYTILP